MQTDCSAELFDFGTVEGRAVEAAFDAGLVTSDAGGLLLGATDRAVGMIDRFAACFHDERRPHLIEHNKQFAKFMANYQVRTFVKPGITGLAQVRGFRGEARNNSDIENRVACDIEYLENWNFSLECAIILRTFAQLITPPRTAY